MNFIGGPTIGTQIAADHAVHLIKIIVFDRYRHIVLPCEQAEGEAFRNSRLEFSIDQATITK
jgi:hypothetical protein